MSFIGYVSMPFGKQHGVNFDEVWESAIFTAPTAATSKGASRVLLFREDSGRPKVEERHRRRLDHYGRPSSRTETRLRDEIQNHIILSDFVVADISYSNPNVMLEVGFAQALRKRIIYITQTFEDNPANLGDLKRVFAYTASAYELLKYHLFTMIKQVVEEVTDEEAFEKERGSHIHYFGQRQRIPLDERFADAKHIIQILTTNLTTVSANYIDSIGTAIENAKKHRRKLEVTILTSDPTNPYISARAHQLGENRVGYRHELEGSLISIAAKLEKEPNCQILTYQDFPVQLWHRIDGTIYVGSSSLLRRTRFNCVFAVSVDVPGIQETYLDHFDELVGAERTSVYSAKPGARAARGKAVSRQQKSRPKNKAKGRKRKK